MVPAVALLLADARTPTGSHAHSGGLEAAVQHGLREPADVADFLRGRLHTVAAVEAAIAASATGSAHAGDLEALDELEEEALARCPSPPLRATAAALGRALLRTGVRLWPHGQTLQAYRSRSTRTPRPVALGVVAAAAGLSAREAAVVSVYDDLAGVATAAVKLLPVDSASALGWVAALAPSLERVAEAAARPRPASELPSASATLVDLRAVPHQSDQRRLFVS